MLVFWNISTVLVPTKYIWRYKPQNANYITSGIPHKNYSLLYLKLASHSIKLKGKIHAHWLIIFISIYLGWHQTVNNKHDHRLRVRPQKEGKLFSTFNITFFALLFIQGNLHFHFAPGLTNDVPGPRSRIN